MGIIGLHPLIKPILKKKHISSYKHQTVGIDGHAWMYLFAAQIYSELFYDTPTTRHLISLEQKINLLLKHKITPFFVFDGEELKSKEKTNSERSLKKEEAAKEARRLLDMGCVEQAKIKMRSCVKIREWMLQSVINFLKEKEIRFMVSPYESDAQLAFLQRSGAIDCIISEDSDLVLYGCTKVLYKFDSSHVSEFNRDQLKDAVDDFFCKNILDISIISGCDYLEGLFGIGLKTAHKLLKNLGSVEEVYKFWSIKKSVPADFLEEFKRAKLTFEHQIVYDPNKHRRVHLSGAEKLNLDFLGNFIENEREFSEGIKFFKRGPINEFCKKSEGQKNIDESEKNEDEAGIVKIDDVGDEIPLLNIEADKKTRKMRNVKIDKNKKSPYF